MMTTFGCRARSVNYYWTAEFCAVVVVVVCTYFIVIQFPHWMILLLFLCSGCHVVVVVLLSSVAAATKLNSSAKVAGNRNEMDFLGQPPVSWCAWNWNESEMIVFISLVVCG